MTTIGEGFGAAGTRVTKRLGPDDEVWLYVWQSIVGSIAIDVALTLVLVGCLIAGWWALSIFLGIVCFLIGVIVLVFGRPSSLFWRYLFGNLWAIGTICGLVVGTTWHKMIHSGLGLLWKQIAVVGAFDWQWYALAGVVLLAVWYKFKWKAMVAIALIAVVTVIVVFSNPAEWLQAWHNLKHLLIPYSWSIIGFMLLLALVMAKEMLFPSLEWTFDPVTLEDLREVGLIGLWMPGLFSKSVESEPGETMERRVRIESREVDEKGRARETYTYLLDSDAARDFYRALSKGRPFTLSEAKRWRVGRKTFEDKIWPAFEERKWAVWKDEDHHDQGRELTPLGHEGLEALVLGDPRH